MAAPSFAVCTMTQTSLPLARLRAVHKRYGNRVALAGVDLSVPASQVLALLGPNGAGKSTAISLLLGLLEPDAGRAELFGQNPGQLGARQRIGVMLQSASLPATLKVRELIDLTRSYYPAPHSLDACADMAGVADLLDRRYGRLSGGQQRRVQFALAMCGRPDLLFLDEPTTGLDIDARRAIWAAIRAHVAGGGAVLLTTHYLEEAEALADRVAVLGGGRILTEGSVADICTRIGQRRVRCRSALAPEALANWPGVIDARRDGPRIEIVTDAAEAVLRRLLAEDAALSELEVERAGLAEAFLQLTADKPAGTSIKEAA